MYLEDIPQPNNGDLLLIYADDILVAYTHQRAKLAERRLTAYLNDLIEYFDEWGLNLNLEKCKSFMFKGRKRGLYRNFRSYIPMIKIGDSVISNDRAIKYLSVIFQEDML